ncbi:hypothetical protein ZEAMMB73_Zm00001d044473 [Zea mays]|uniref:Uncharacterized protein n=2 Tax=Andropogoneae TaxID=147429 RepID=A0A1D6NM37_MAIZE|nr:hypothetical protein ZEAMMB73_Zm00001d010435 [Zea mays]ONM41269.1 hypothetical protein ZEAMMB73_Zm00001d044473 [Zea mays]
MRFLSPFPRRKQ